MSSSWSSKCSAPPSPKSQKLKTPTSSQAISSLRKRCNSLHKFTNHSSTLISSDPKRSTSRKSSNICALLRMLAKSLQSWSTSSSRLESTINTQLHWESTWEILSSTMIAILRTKLLWALSCFWRRAKDLRKTPRSSCFLLETLLICRSTTKWSDPWCFACSSIRILTHSCNSSRISARTFNSTNHGTTKMENKRMKSLEIWGKTFMMGLLETLWAWENSPWRRTYLKTSRMKNLTWT